MKRLFYRALKGICEKCRRKLGVWRDGVACCYNCDLHRNIKSNLLKGDMFMDNIVNSLHDDINYLLNNFLKEVTSEIQIAQDRLSESVSKSLFELINDLPSNHESQLPLQQQIAYQIGRIDTLKNQQELIEELQKNISLKITQNKHV
jgi:hypothetical protein